MNANKSSGDTSCPHHARRAKNLSKAILQRSRAKDLNGVSSEDEVEFKGQGRDDRISGGNGIAASV